MTHFSWLGTICRTSIAVLHCNENVKRETKRSATGEKYDSVTYPKFKNGGEVFRERKVPPTFNYVSNIKHVLLSTSKEELASIFQHYKAEAPEPVNHKFPNTRSRTDAIENQLQKWRHDILPQGEEQQQSDGRRSTEEMSTGAAKETHQE